MNTKITRITLQGFKSFNKKISVPFVEGFNIVCGPNGVGKSNIVDAICFVLGRASAKSLRAGRLHELIFHGGDGKSPAQRASVILYLDNSKKIFSFDDPEVSVTRKVNKKGVCVYKIQGKTTTREKVLELLSSARIHPDGHNIILQGDITNVIEMNPVERRTIIDEISGIAEYNEKKRKAERDLNVVDQKLKEAEIIITERYDIFRRLEEERNAAVRYQNLQKQLVILKSSLAHRKLVDFEKNINILDEETEKSEKENESLQAEIEEIEAELEKRENEIQEVANKLIRFSEIVEAEKEVSLLKSKVMVNKDRIDSNKREIKRLDSLIERLKVMESRRVEMEEGVPRSVKAILKQNLKGVFGTVSSVIKVPEKYKIAIEIASGFHLNDIIVDDDKTAKFCIEYLKRERIGRATFLPLNKIKPRFLKETFSRRKGVLGVASKLVKYDSRFSKAVEFVLGSTLIVENLDIARGIGIGKVRMVTLEGDLIETSGAMIGGYFRRTYTKLTTSIAKSEIEEYEKIRRNLEEEIKNLTSQTDELEKKLKKYSNLETTKEFAALKKIRLATEKELDKLRKRRKEIYERKLTLQTEINKFKIRRAKIEAEFETVKLEALQYGKVKFIEKSIRILTKSISDVQQELLSLGAVNFKAIEQYEKFKSEFDEYKKKYEKILEEKKAVLDMIEKIEEKRREVFNRCLQEVSNYFNDMFNKMMKGSASLELDNPLDLESGLVIQANPVGKMMLNIDSLSGGEKTLTALAFLFSVQKYKPAPFYILDEVDAALDKENSKKIAELIKSLSKEEQFLVITHNEQTIKYGDIVYGVTMETGESKILGLEMPG